MHKARRARRMFLASWAVIALGKCVVAALLPLFVDEAFYWQEGQHLALAYSDLPGLTAWLAALGTSVGGHALLGLRWPFLVLGAAVPWLVVAAARPWTGERNAWLAGALAAWMPLSGTLGVLALPDVPMAFAAGLCLVGGARLLTVVPGDTRRAWPWLAVLAAGLAVGALSHYRFVGVIGTGLIALLAVPSGRLWLRAPGLWLAVLFGALAWWPLLQWNLANADAGLRFQLVDRHPWTFDWHGAWFVVVQAALVTPPLLWAMLRAAARPGQDEGRRYFAWLGGVSTVGFFLLGFFADVERVSFHWPLPGYLALLVLVPDLLGGWSRRARKVSAACLVAAMAITAAGAIVVGTPLLREQSAASKFYPVNFAGWDDLAVAVRESLADLPPGTRLVADDFKVGAELGFALGRGDIAVLDHPLNRKHGRAPQLAAWGQHVESRMALSADVPTLLVLAPGDVKLRALAERYRAVCRMVGPLPSPRSVRVDHGRQRFLLFVLPPGGAPGAEGACTAPVVGAIDAPASGAAVARVFEVTGWAFRNGAAPVRVDVLLDGQVLAIARTGLARPGLGDFGYVVPTHGTADGPLPAGAGLAARVDAGNFDAGRHWLGLRVVHADGTFELLEEQPVVLR